MTNIKKFFWEEDLPPLHYRPGTSDEIIIDDIIIKNAAYHFPMLSGIKRVYDIGSNIGVAAVVLAKFYPEAVIHCFEPEPENFKLLQMNTEYLGSRVVLNNAALSDKSGHLPLFPSKDSTNLGAFTVLPDHRFEDIPSEAHVPLIKMADYCKQHGTPEILKIDCEGAEADIIRDIPDLTEVLWIAGELHDIKSWEILGLLDPTHKIETRKAMGAECWPFHAGHRLLLLEKSQATAQ